MHPTNTGSVYGTFSGSGVGGGDDDLGPIDPLLSPPPSNLAYFYDGSDGPLGTCDTHLCANGGVCLEDRWDSPSCDCDLTSFDGPNCQDGKRYRNFIVSQNACM